MNSKKLMVLVVTAFVLGIAIFWLSLFREAGTSDGLEKVTFVLNWTPSGMHAAYYAALDEGYFREEGLDVQILEGSGSGTTVKVIGAGREEFGLAGAESIAIGRSKGIPIVSLAAIYQRSAVALLTLETSGIKDFKDLVGRTMGVKFGSSTFPLYEATLKQLAIDRSKINEVSIGPGVEPLLAGKIDAMDGQIDNEAIQIRERGFPVHAILYDDLGIKSYGVSLFANEKTISERPKTVEKFVRAILKGWKFTLNAPEKGAAAVCKFNPTLDQKIVFAQTKATIEMLVSEDSLANGVGSQSKEGWQTTIKTLTEIGQINESVDADRIFTSEFLKRCEKVEIPPGK